MAEQITREILELAAKAGGIDMQHKRLFNGDVEPGYYLYPSDGSPPQWVLWNPSTNPGDCADLEAACGVDVVWHGKHVIAGFGGEVMATAYYRDHPTKQAARMYASTMCAAEIGRNKK